MKILMVSSGFPPKINTGAEKFCFELSKKLIENGYDVEVASDVELDSYDNIRLHKLTKIKQKIPRKLFFDYYNPINQILLRKIIRKVKPDIFHFHNIYGISSKLIKLASKKKPTVITLHDYWPICFLSTLTIDKQECDMNCKNCKHPLARITNKIKEKHLKKSVLVAPSKFMQKKLLAYGYKNVNQIYNGINVENSISPLNRRILFIGRLTEEKGISLLLEELKDLDEKIDVIGKGPLLERLRTKYKDNVKIKFHGFVKDITKEYLLGGILVFPSLWVENLPYVLLEGMSYGLPIIATNIGSIPDIVRNEKTGLLFDNHKNDDLANKVRYLINNNDLQIKLRERALEFLVSNFTWSKIINEYSTLYSSLFKINRR